MKQVTILLPLLTLCVNSCCMKSMYSANDLANHLNTKIYPKAGKFEKSKYFNRASITTICKRKKPGDKHTCYIFSKHIQNGKPKGEGMLVAWDAFFMAFQAGRSYYPGCSKSYCHKTKEISEVWNTLEKKLEKSLQKLKKNKK